MNVSDTPPTWSVTPIDGYVFRANLIRDMLIYWGLGDRSCMLTGHKGCGKTSLVEQFHYQLNANLLSMTGNGKTGLEALFGQYVMNGDGKLIWQDGPVALAARSGYSVLINEFNAMPEDVQIALNDLAHNGSPITLPECGEQFMPEPGFRLFCSINPKGSNDFMYRGRKEMDAALKERFFWIAVEYGSADEEEAIVRGIWQKNSNLAESACVAFAKQMVEVATAVRLAAVSTGADAIPEIISTRVLCNWARYWIAYARNPGSTHLGLQRALTHGCRPEVACQIHKIVEAVTSVPSPYKMV